MQAAMGSINGRLEIGASHCLNGLASANDACPPKNSSLLA